MVPARKKNKKLETLAILGIALLCTLGIVVAVKVAEWIGLLTLSVREVKFGLTQMDILILITILFGGGIAGALFVLRKTGYIFNGGAPRW